MEYPDYRKLFDVGESITLSRKFFRKVESHELDDLNGCPPLWVVDCINTQEEQGHLKIVDVRQNYIKVKATNTWMLSIDYINLYHLERYRDNNEILYAFANNQADQRHKRNLSVPLSKAFDWKCTPEGVDFWVNVLAGKKIDFKKADSPIKENKETTNKSKQELIQETIQNNNNHEIRLQKQKAVVIRGTRPKGSRICCSEHKVTVRSGQISYKACHC